MNKIIRIGTRESELALWQARSVQKLLEENHISAELVPVKSSGDKDLVTPLYAMGVQGVFTKTLDAFLLSDKVDIAVHSFKDVPTQMAAGIIQMAVLPRASFKDLLVLKPGRWAKQKEDWQILNPAHEPLTYHIATGSIRRRAQWLHRFPNSRIENLRGNLQTRLRKLQENSWDGAIFAEAGLDRMGLKPPTTMVLNWMLPAPAQGVIVVTGRENDKDIQQIISRLNNSNTELCAKIERDFLSGLMGGCSTPISAHAVVEGNLLYFKGNILSPDGKHKLETEKQYPLDRAANAGKDAAQELLAKGAAKIVEEIRNFEKLY